MTRSAFTGASVAAPSTVTTGIDWSTVRGAFVVSGRLYTGHADGTMTVRDFDGTTAGFTTPIGLNGLTSTQFPISRITGMFLWNGRLYYTLSGDVRLFYRWFTPERGILGADTFSPPGSPPAPPRSSAAPPSTARPGSPGACSSSTSPRNRPRPPARTSGCGPDPFRYPAPGQPL